MQTVKAISLTFDTLKPVESVSDTGVDGIARHSGIALSL